MAGIQDRSVIIDRYNHACSAYQSATAALKRGNVEDYESGLVGAAQAVWNVLEWAVRFHLEHDCIQQLSTADRESLRRTQFDVWVNLLGKLNPPVDQMTRRQLLQHRVLRNRSTHDGMLPGQRPVLTALASARRFLVQRMFVPAEQLLVAADDAPPEPQPTPAPAEAFGETPQEPTLGEHRKLGLQLWLEQTVAKGVTEARVRRGGRYDATLDSLALEAKALLTRDAIALCLAARGPDDLLVAPETSAEEEVQRLLFVGPTVQLDAQSVMRLRHLVPLLQRRTSLCVDAGWLKQQDQGVTFASSTLPVMLVGAAIAAQVAESSALRTLAGARLDWAEAGWAAASAGDDIRHWSSLLLQTPASPALLSRVIATATAFGAAPSHVVVTDSLVSAFRLCVLTLVWCSPVRTDAFDRQQEQDCPWFLPVGAWRRALLDLAHLASVIQQDSRLLLNISDIYQMPEPLNAVVKSLDMILRLKEEQAAAVLALCAPYQAARASRLGEHLFSAVFSSENRMFSTPDFMSFWIKSYACPALWSWDQRQAARLLTVPGQTRPAGFLLNRLELHDEWAKAWQAFVIDASHEEVASAWVESLGFVSSRDDEKTLEMVRAGFQMLAGMGLGVDVRQRLRRSLKPISTDPKQPGNPSVQVEILRQALATSGDFAQVIDEWTEKPALAWRTLLAAGAPDDAIARWCMAKLAVFQDVPPAYRDGPVGIIGSPGLQALRTDHWQLAFAQAREALDYLLDHGSAAAILVIADACTPREKAEPKVDPIMGKMPVANLSIPLSQVIWGRVIERVEGREALYLLVESGKRPSGLNFFKSKPFQGFEYDVWTKAAAAVEQRLVRDAPIASGRNARDAQSLPGPTEQQRAEADRLLAAFERRVQDDPWLAWGNGTPVRAAMAALTSASGADVSLPVAALIDELMKEPASRGNACLLIGIALKQLASHHAERAKPILEAALHPALLTAMRRDDTAEFWFALLSYHGCQRVLAELERLDFRDLGLGFFDALQSVDERTLLEWHLHPAMMRPALLRAAQQQFVPAEAFWDEAWATERSPDEVPELVLFVDGQWLTRLLEKSSAWSDSARIKLLRHMAMYSAADKVRVRCLTAIYMADEQWDQGSVTDAPPPTGRDG